jgi:hypothetical protein
MSNREAFKRVKSVNYRGSIVAMVLTQALIFSFELSVIANIAAYIINFIGWIVIGAVLEVVAATYYGIDLSKKGNRL